MLTTFQSKNVLQLCKLLIALPATLVVILAWTTTEELVTQLRLDHAVLQAAEDDFRAQRKYSGLGGSEAADYAAYIARLQRRVFEDCRAIVHSGLSWPEDLPCPAIVPRVTQSADISTREEQTRAEQIAALDRKLNAGLGDYDERLLQEQERIKAARPNDNSGAGGGSGAADGGVGDDGQNGGGAVSGRAAEEATGQSASGPIDSSPGSGEAGNNTDQPVDIPDGSDDDIVARQLREAAERETDPELKAKLWEEYCRYKQGTN